MVVVRQKPRIIKYGLPLGCHVTVASLVLTPAVIRHTEDQLFLSLATERLVGPESEVTCRLWLLCEQMRNQISLGQKRSHLDL